MTTYQRIRNFAVVAATALVIGGVYDCSNGAPAPERKPPATCPSGARFCAK